DEAEIFLHAVSIVQVDRDCRSFNVHPGAVRKRLAWLSVGSEPRMNRRCGTRIVVAREMSPSLKSSVLVRGIAAHHIGAAEYLCVSPERIAVEPALEEVIVGKLHRVGRGAAARILSEK